VKLFFYGTAVFLTTVILSGCGTSSENNGQGYATKRTDVIMPGTGLPNTGVPSLGTALQDTAPSNTSLSMPALPYVASPNAVPPESASGDTRGMSLNSVPEIKPIRSVAENVWLGKENIGGMTETELLSKLKGISSKTDVAAIDASYDSKTWEVKEGKFGKRLDMDKIIKAALSSKEGQVIQYSYSHVQPEINSKQLKDKIKLVAQYNTPFLDRSRSRIKNIRLTSAKLDKKIILPGHEFSFNASTGSKSKKAGYENATVIVRTPKGPKHKKAPGGGVCQVSTTLYNAVMKCGLKVTERHEHSDEVYYVPDGKDATVTYGGPDFRFVNTRSSPIMLRVTVSRRSLQVKVYENTAAGAR
jgi:vancomycin resistance protein YoaR